MRKLLILAGVALLLASCGISAPNTLYDWGASMSDTYAYDYYSYYNFKTQSEADLCNLICTYERMVSRPGGKRQVPPPGICAEYGYLLLQPRTAEIFDQYATESQKKMFGGDIGTSFFEKGNQLIQKEMELYPESQVFLMPLYKKWSSK